MTTTTPAPLSAEEVAKRLRNGASSFNCGDAESDILAAADLIEQQAAQLAEADAVIARAFSNAKSATVQPDTWRAELAEKEA